MILLNQRVPRGQKRANHLLDGRPDKVKNITGLVEWYGENRKLRDLVNLVIVGGLLEPSQSNDREEIEEINKMHSLMDKYQLKGQIRWIKAQTERVRNGELYRCIADTRGAFVQVKKNSNTVKHETQALTM